MKSKVNLRCNPYRGILKEMGKELGMPVDQIHKGLFRPRVPNPSLAELFNKKIEERETVVKVFKKNTSKSK